MKYSIKSIKYSLKSLLSCLMIMALGSSISFAAKPGGGPATAELTPDTLNLVNAVQGSSILSGDDSGSRATFSWSIPANLQVASGAVSNIVSFNVDTNVLTIQTRGRGTFSAEIILSSTTDGAYLLANTRADISLIPADVTVNVSGGSDGGIDDGYIGGRNATQVFDTSFAVEFSYSCLTGGCHETDQTLVDEYAASNMTHTMVKCNACHGTHTADTVGLEKPNLTGYFPGIGATGYIVGRDRCKACHNNQHNGGRASTNDCKSCHTPHVFAPPNGGSNW
ncbi:MAG: cytochrome c3 family protein [Gammaproteobacteria bacterium]|nr:cytochrome c3 family protein [Gammaproteobacteria bacterium]